MIEKNKSKFYYAFINALNKKNNKLYSIKLLEKVLYIIWKKEKKAPFNIFFIAIKQLTPVLNLKKTKYRRKTIKIPTIQLYNFYRLGIINLLNNVNLINKNKTTSFEIALSKVILDTYHKKSQDYLNKVNLYNDVIQNKLNSKFT